MAKRKTKQKNPALKKPERRAVRAVEKVPRLAHKILTQTIWPAKLDFEEAMEVVITLAKALVISNTDDDDPEDRAELIECVENHFLSAMDELNPYDDPEHDHVHAWLVAPQGLITEPVGFLWSGSADDGVDVLIGTKLEELRAELAASSEETCVVVTEGVEGLAMTDPEWDGESTIRCANPQCGNVHDVHLTVAENLFQQARQQPSSQPN